MTENEELDIAEDEEFAELGALKSPAPATVFTRLEKRVRAAQLGKDLVEKQAFAFWTVIDAFLRLIFVSNKKSEIEKETGEK